MKRLHYKSLSLHQKIELIKEVDCGGKRKDIAAKFGIPQSTLTTIYKCKENIITCLNDAPNLKVRKRLRTAKNLELDKAVTVFINEAREKNVPLTGEIIKGKAKRFSDLMNIGNFTGSSGWLSRYKKRHGLKWKCLAGDSAGAKLTVAREWMQQYCKQILSEYDASDIFNGDETGLLYRCFPGKSMVFDNDNCKNGKRAKDRITIMLCCNMSGSELLKPLVIGYSQKPRCFKHVKSLPVEYHWNKKAWMTTRIFEKWIIELDDKFQKENRQVAFFFDNCSAHSKQIQCHLSSITLHFFPPNLTSVLQPMDLGIIRSVKAHYRNEIVLNLISEIENNSPISKISLLQCINNISKIWEQKVTPEIIQNCYRKAGFIECLSVGSEDSTSLSDGQQNLDYLCTLNHDNSNPIFQNYVDVDSNLTISPFLTDEELVQSITKCDNNDVEITETSILETSVPFVKHQDAKNSIMTLLTYVEQSENVPKHIFTHINEIRCFLNC